MDRTVAIFGKFLEDMPDASLRTNDGIPGNPESLGQRIGGLEANAMDIERQPIRILLDADNRLIPIGLINPDSTCGANPMRVQEDHDLPDDFLGLPRLDHSLLAFGANPIELSQPFGRLFNDVKHLLAKRLDEFFGKVRPDTFDHPRTQILFNAFEGTRRDDAEGLRLKLEPMRPIVHPHALALNVLARGDGRCWALSQSCI